MPILKIAPGLVVNTDNVESVEQVEHTDKYDEPHVLVNFKEFGRDVDPEYTLDEITAALNEQCYYRKQWTDEVGEIDVCVLHGNNSRHDPALGPFRLCLTKDPYITYGGDWSVARTVHAPDISQSWEYETKHMEQLASNWRENYKNDPPRVIPPVISYEDTTHRGFWARVFNL
jgi:hypothetical protein